MKKLLALLLALTMVLALSACGDTGGDAAADDGSADAGTPADGGQEGGSDDALANLTAIPPKNGSKYVIGISQPTMGHPVRQAAQVLIEEWLVDNGDLFEVIVTDGQLNAQKQIADIEDLIAKDVDVILVAAHQSSTLVSVLREAQDAGIPVIPFDRVLADTSVQVGSVVNDDFNAGIFAAELLVEKIGTSGSIAIIQGAAGSSVATLRNDGFLSVIEDTDIQVVADQVAEFQRVQAVDIFEDILQANPNLDAVYCHNDEMALGVMQVLESADRLDIVVIGLDGQKDALESIIDGKLYATVRRIVEFPYALDLAKEYLTTGGIQEPNIFLNPLKITIDNVNDYYNPDAVF